MLSVLFVERNRVSTIEELYLIGVVSLFLASKYVDYDSLNIDIIVTKLAHNRFNASEIRAKEFEVLSTLEYSIDSSTTYEFIQMLFLDFFAGHLGEIDEEDLKTLEEVLQLSIYFGVMCCYDYNMLKYK